MSSSNPFAPKSYRERPALRPPDHPPMARLRRLGLDPDEEAQVYADYNAMTAEEKFDSLERLEFLDDDELRQQIVEGRQQSLVGAPAPRLDVPEGKVADVLEWVAADPVRARSALELELSRKDPRKTLVEALEIIA